jgi:hypothetical protein
VILFDDVVEVFDLTDLDANFSFGIVAFDRRRIGAALVDRDLLRRSVPLDYLAQESQRSFAIPFGGQQKIYRSTGLSTARYRYFHAPLTRTLVSSIRQLDLTGACALDTPDPTAEHT